MEIHTYVSAIDKGATIVKETVGVGRQIVFKMNSHIIKQDSSDDF